MGIEWYAETSKSLETRATIYQNGQIAINALACQRFGLEVNQKIALGFDGDESKIVIKTLDESQAERFRLRHTGGGILIISARAFLSYFGIPYGRKPRKFKLHRREDNGELWFEIPMKY